MKYCYKCGNSMEDDMLFCQKCGTKCISSESPKPDTASKQDSYAEYWGLSYKDFESSKEIELTPDGVHIFKQKGMKRFQFDKIIPYTQILEVNSVRASAMTSGYLSIITTTEGISGTAPRKQLLNDHNTVLFTKKAEPEVERIYRAIEDILSVPPISNATTIHCENAAKNLSQSGFQSLANPVKKKRRNGCLVLIVCSIIFLVTVAVIPKLIQSEGTGGESQANQVKQTEDNSPEDYELMVFESFWESASDYFGIEYSDYKWTDTATSYICDYETNGGYSAYYYLIKTAFETKNAYGQKISHEVTARCYYVPDYSNTVYITYLTLDGDKVYYDEETENWLMNMDGGGTEPIPSE